LKWVCFIDANKQKKRGEISVLNKGVSVESKCLIVHVFAIHEDEHSVQGVDTIFSRSNCEESADLSNQTYEIIRNNFKNQSLEVLFYSKLSSSKIIQIEM